MTKMDTKRGITEAFAEASGKLMAYMNGENDGNVKMDTTLPKTVLNIIKEKVKMKLNHLKFKQCSSQIECDSQWHTVCFTTRKQSMDRFILSPTGNNKPIYLSGCPKDSVPMSVPASFSS